MRLLQRWVPLRRIEGYATKCFQADRGVRVIPLAHGGTAIDVDFVNELDILEEHWDELQDIARRQDEASRTARRASS